MQAGQLRQEALDNETARPVLSTLKFMQAKRAASLPLGKPHARRSMQAGHVGASLSVQAGPLGASKTGPAFCHASAVGKPVKLR
jgi:hypothetical protein